MIVFAAIAPHGDLVLGDEPEAPATRGIPTNAWLPTEPLPASFHGDWTPRSRRSVSRRSGSPASDPLLRETPPPQNGPPPPKRRLIRAATSKRLFRFWSSSRISFDRSSHVSLHLPNPHG